MNDIHSAIINGVEFNLTLGSNSEYYVRSFGMFDINPFYAIDDEIYDVIDLVSDPNGLAIDLGSFIGITSIYLCNRFKKVISIEADKESLLDLKMNLEKSHCHNVTVINKAISNYSGTLLFGARGFDNVFGNMHDKVNVGTSTIKSEIDGPNVYEIESITLEEIISQYCESPSEVKFIKCDIEAGEENIFWDLLHFANMNNIYLYVSFHITWWKDKNIRRFDDSFEYFKGRMVCYAKNPFERTEPTKIDNISDFLENNHYASILFLPR
jgi:FkbM family methyltransferase